MSAEDKLHKLKVTELKDLLGKHNLPLVGKKDDLIKRLVENGITGDEGEEEELTDPTPAASTSEPSAPSAAAPSGSDEANEASTSTSAPATSETSAPTLTPEQQAMKARAERFGVPFNPNPTTSSASRSTKTPSAAPASTSKETVAPTKAEPKPKAGAIDKAPIGVSEDTLAKRAARFGIPEKKAETPGEGAVRPSTAPPTKKELRTADPEITPEQAAKIAEDEEKKRKRAEKFGTGAKPDPTADTNGADSTGPAYKQEAKKAKV